MSVRSQLTQEELDAPQSPITLTRDELAATAAALQVILDVGWEPDPEDQARKRATISAYHKVCAAKLY